MRMVLLRPLLTLSLSWFCHPCSVSFSTSNAVSKLLRDLEKHWDSLPLKTKVEIDAEIAPRDPRWCFSPHEQRSVIVLLYQQVPVWLICFHPNTPAKFGDKALIGVQIVGVSRCYLDAGSQTWQTRKRALNFGKRCFLRMVLTGYWLSALDVGIGFSVPAEGFQWPVCVQLFFCVGSGTFCARYHGTPFGTLHVVLVCTGGNLGK